MTNKVEEEIEYSNSNKINIESVFANDNIDIYNISNENKEELLNKNESITAKCYYTCEECDKIGDNNFHNCLRCNKYYLYKIKINKYYNCYEKCSNYYYLDNDINYYCTINSTCPNKYPILFSERKECVRNNIIKDELKNEDTKKTKEEEIKYYDNILNKIEEGFTSENFDTAELDKGIDEIIETKLINFTFAVLHNQKMIIW